MKAYEFKPELTPAGDLKLPAELRMLLAAETAALDSVLLLIHDHEEDRDWKALTAAQFLAGYDDADAIYDAVA